MRAHSISLSHTEGRAHSFLLSQREGKEHSLTFSLSHTRRKHTHSYSLTQMGKTHARSLPHTQGKQTLTLTLSDSREERLHSYTETHTFSFTETKALYLSVRKGKSTRTFSLSHNVKLEGTLIFTRSKTHIVEGRGTNAHLRPLRRRA